MARLIELPDGQYAEFPDDMSDSDIESALSAQFPAEEPELDSAWDFSGDRTIIGRAKEFGLAVPRQAIDYTLSALQGYGATSKVRGQLEPYTRPIDFLTSPVSTLSNLVKDAGVETGQDLYGAITGKKSDKKTAEEAKDAANVAVQQFASDSRKWLNEDSILKGDEKYQDLWTTQLGGAFGSFIPQLGVAARSPTAAIMMGGYSGAGTQAEKVKQARMAGIPVSTEAEAGALTAGFGVGLLENFTPFRILKALKGIPKDIPVPDKKKIFGLLKDLFKPSVIKTGVGEGTQEMTSSVLQQLIEMGYNPDAELPSGESLWNDFSLGFVAGSGAEVVTNAIESRRLQAIKDIDSERERKFREAEEANNFLMGNYLRENAELRDLAQRDPDAFNLLSLKERQAASAIEMPTTEEVLKFNEPSMATKEPTPASTGELYAMRIIGRLRSFFPTNTTFGVAEGPGGFVVTDADGTQYGKPMADQRVASSVAANLNREVSNKGIRGSILNTLMTSPEEYSKDDMDALFRYGFRTLSPEANRVSFAALNESAGTTTEKGYVEDLPMEVLATAKKLRDGRYSIQMPDGSTQYIAGLTAAQKLNMERVNAGLPAATTFDINEARQALGGKIGALAEPTVSGIMDTAQYGGTLQDGKPVVLSDAGEVLTGRVVTDAEKARAGKDADGNNILPDFLEFKTLDEAKRYAGRLNQRGAASRFIPLEILMGKENLSDDIKRLMKAKNITSEINSPEVKQLVKAFTGAESFGDMSLDDQKLFYSRVRELPTLSKPTKLPSFSERLYTPEQFLQAVKAENEAGRALTDAEIAAATGLNPDAPGIADIRGELRRQNQRREEEGRREVEEVQPLESALRKILESFKLDPNLLRLRTRLYDENGRDITEGSEGYYEPALNELALAIDSIDPQGIKTEAQRIQALRGVLTHESIHILRKLDLFTQKEWSLLENAVARTKRKPKKGEPQLDETYLQRARRMYPDMSPTIQVEEAIAELARDAIGDRRVIGGKPKNLIDRIVRFFTQLRNFMDGYGFTSFQDVLRAVETGEIGGRERGQVRSLRLTEEMNAKQLGIVPARYKPFIDEFRGAAEPGQETAGAVPGEEVAAGRLSTEAAPGPDADFDIRPTGASMRYSRKDVKSSKDWTYSPLMKAVESVSPKVTTAKQWDQWLDANAPRLGVSKDEIEFSGIKDFIALKEGRVSKDDVLAYLDQNGVQVTETILGESPIKGKQKPFTYRRSESGYGWDVIDNNYPEQYPDGLFAGHIEGTEQDAIEEVRIANEELESGIYELHPFSPFSAKYSRYTLPGGKDYRELALTLPGKELYRAPRAHSMGDKADVNRIAHTRIDTRTDANGDPVLFVNEIQSDWGQEGRKQGFANAKSAKNKEQIMRELDGITNELRELTGRYAPTDEDWKANLDLSSRYDALSAEYRTASNTGTVPTAPFVTDTKSWVALTIKRLLRYAVDNGFKKVAFINGQQAADLYDLSERVREIAYTKKGNKYELAVTSSDGEGISLPKDSFDESELEGIVGKEIAEKIIKGEGNKYRGREDTVLEGVDLKVGGEGMKSFYDRIVPQVATDVIRKIGGKGLSNSYVPTRNPYQGAQKYIDMEFVEGVGKKFKISGLPELYDTYADADEARYQIYVREGAELTRQTAIEITPEMERNILAGQRLFSRKDMPDTIEVDGVQRPTVNSKGQQIHNTEDGVRNFWRWFSPSPRQLLDGLSVSEIGSLKRNTEALSDFIESQSGLSEPDRFTVIPSPVFSHVAGVVDNQKILNAIVSSLPVDVVNFLTSNKISPKEFLHNPSVFKDVLSIDPASYVSLGINPSRIAELAIRVVANAGAKISGLTSGTLERNSAILANANDPVLGAHVRKSPSGDLGIIAGFGDSKVVDSDGRPMVVYHGTRHSFDEFKRDGRRGNDRLHYFSADPAVASEYAGDVRYGKPNVMPVYVSLQKPFKFDAAGEQWGSLPMDIFPPEIAQHFDERNILRGREGQVPRIGFTDVIRGAIDAGYGGVIADNIRDGGGPYGEQNPSNVVVAHRNTQIKSAIANTGAFSPESSDIRYSRKDTGQPEVRNPNLVQRSPEVLQETVQKVEKSVADTGKYSVPLYNPKASPEALYVALNPDAGEKLDTEERRRYSRRNAPDYDPKAKAIMDRVIPQVPDETTGEFYINKMKGFDAKAAIDRARANLFFQHARLERQYRENPELAKMLADTSALAMVQMADHAHQFIMSALTMGVPVYRNGMFTTDKFFHNGKQYNGLIEVMDLLKTPDGKNFEQLAHAYATAVRGERLNKEGKLTPVNPGELKVLEAEVNRFINPETGKPIVKEWFDAWQAYNSHVVKYLRDTGIVDDEGAALWLKQADYVPFYREDKNGKLLHPRVFGGMHTAGQFKAVGTSDEALNIDMLTAIQNNLNAAIAMGMRNVAQQRVVRDQINLGLGRMLNPGEDVGDRTTVSFKRKGKKQTAIIDDPLIYHAMLPISEIPMDNILGQVFRGPAELLRSFIVHDPAYMIANSMRDSASSWVITGAKIIPGVSTVKNLAADLDTLKRHGVIGNYNLLFDKDQVRKFYEKESRKRKGYLGQDWTRPWEAVWDGLGRMNQQIDAATRVAVYEDVLKRTGNEAEAQYQALSVMNYGRRGANPFVRYITAISPFLNTRFQGMDKLFQAGFGRSGALYKKDANGKVIREANWRKNAAVFYQRSAVIMGLSIMYWWMVSDDDEYKNATPEIRDNYYIIPVEKGDIETGKPGLSFRIPIPFEIGLLFKVVPERILETIFGDDTPKDLKDSFWRNLHSTLAVNWPQAILPLVEWSNNKDSYSGRPIVPTYMLNLPPEEQKNFYTNRGAVWLGEKLGVSPMKLEAAAYGYGGTIGGYFLQLMDSLMRQGAEEKPGLAWHQFPVIKRFFATANQPGLQAQFYDLKDSVDGITKTVNELSEQGKYDELATFYAKNGHMYDMRSDINFLNRQITKLRDERKMVEQMDIPPESKRILIEQINMQIAAELTTVPMLRKQAFGPKPETEE